MFLNNTWKVPATSLSVYKMNNTRETSKIISGMQRTNSRMICNIIYYIIKLKKKMGLPRWRSVRVLNWQCRRCKIEHEFYPWVGKIPLEGEMATHSSILARRIPWTEEPGRLYIPWGCKESDTTEWVHVCMHTHMRAHTHAHTKKKTPWLEQYVPKRQLIKFCSHYKTCS